MALGEVPSEAKQGFVPAIDVVEGPFRQYFYRGPVLTASAVPAPVVGCFWSTSLRRQFVFGRGLS